MQKDNALGFAQIGTPKLVHDLGGKGCLAKLTQQINGLFPNKSALYEMKSQDALKILNDPKFILPDDEASLEKYGHIYTKPEQQQKNAQKQVEEHRPVKIPEMKINL